MIKKQSNPGSTGGVGFSFENHVQASYVTLMMTGGRVPTLPSWPVVEVKLQAKIEGFQIDDVIVVVKSPTSNETRKLLGQMKRSVGVKESDSGFKETIEAGWNDYNNTQLFKQGYDSIALITAALSEVDQVNVLWLLNHARHTKNAEDFFRNVKTARFSPNKAEAKLKVIRDCLKDANAGVEPSNDQLYDFLKHFHILSYDLDNEYGIALSLIQSHISQFDQVSPQNLWARILAMVQAWNQHAGSITYENVPEDLKEAFRHRVVTNMPTELSNLAQLDSVVDWNAHPEASLLALLALVGSWNEDLEVDRLAVSKLVKLEYSEWIVKAREILNTPDSPLSVRNGIWSVNNRLELLKSLNRRIFDENLKTFQDIALEVLKEENPAFELDTEKRFAASIYNKTLKYSGGIRQGVADSLAILNSLKEELPHTSHGFVESTCSHTITGIFDNADWKIWGGLNRLLPILAESAPQQFFYQFEMALGNANGPLKELLSQSKSGLTSQNYLVGVVWALELLAWNEKYFIKACVALAEFEMLCNKQNGSNSPVGSLVSILLPWYPQTTATISKRFVAIDVIAKDFPEVAWEVVLQLLPNQHKSTSGTFKPKYCSSIIPDKELEVPRQEYHQQIVFYCGKAIEFAKNDKHRLSQLIDISESLTKKEFGLFLDTFKSEYVKTLPANDKQILWSHFEKLIRKHRRWSSADWALPEHEICRIEDVASTLAPSDPRYKHLELFVSSSFDLFEENGDWKQQEQKLHNLRKSAIKEIYDSYGLSGVYEFLSNGANARFVGSSLGGIADKSLDEQLLPSRLVQDTQDFMFIESYISSRHHESGWGWADSFDRSNWSNEQSTVLLICLPFCSNTWDRVSDWLNSYESVYWKDCHVRTYQENTKLSYAIDWLLKVNRPKSAVACLSYLLRNNEVVNDEAVVQALIDSIDSKEPKHQMDLFDSIELIKHIQTSSDLDEKDIIQVEWSYLSILDGYHGVIPKLIYSKLKSEAEFFCEVICLVYRSTKTSEKGESNPSVNKQMASQAWQLLNHWNVTPGTLDDGTLDASVFNDWIKKALVLCGESGHIDVACSEIGKVLFYSPKDPTGLWIHKDVAAVLDNKENEIMRNGFRVEVFNSRGCHTVNPSGEDEFNLETQFLTKAEEVENAYFYRFSETLRSVADVYHKEALQVRSDYSE